MVLHYNAFISYKHAPEDNRVAEAIHKGLERFHIPTKIQKQTGFRRINRIFRDTEELPITSNLNDTIADALDNSDYLIVICSTNTKESIWVQREIEYFLRNHSIKQVYTVLVNGDPQQVIPEILQYEDRQFQDQYGQLQTVRVPIEPLSCDYRMPLGKADKIELPRLVSGLIGCSYDELMNRRRQYVMKQVMLGFSAVLLLTIAFCGYLVYSRNAIHENYLESLRSQSKYLANESEKLLENELRITALQLALEALPKNAEDERPVIPEAVKALTDATLAYESNTGNNIHAMWDYHMPNYVSDFQLSPKRTSVAVRDSGNVIGVWNTRTHESMLYLDKISSSIDGMKYLTNESLVYWISNRIFCYNVQTGKLLWEYPLEDDRFKTQKNMVVGDGTFYIATYNNKLLEIDTSTGELKNTCEFPVVDELVDFGVSNMSLSGDKNKIGFYGLLDWQQYVYGVLDLTTQQFLVSETIDRMVLDVGWADNKLMIAYGDADPFNASMSIGEVEILAEDDYVIKCIDPSDLSDIWKADFTCNGVRVNGGFLGLNNDASVLYYSGNVGTIYDVKTGKKQFNHNVNSSIIYASDLDEDGNPVYVTDKGGYAVPALSVGNKAVYNYSFFSDNLNKVIFGGEVYASRRSGTELIVYGYDVYDPNWTSISKDITINGTADEYIMNDNVLAILSEEDGKPKLTTIGLKEKDKIVQNELPGDSFSDFELLGYFQNNVYLTFIENDSLCLLSSDISTGEIKTEKLYESAVIARGVAEFSNGTLVYIFRNEEFKSEIAMYDLTTKEKKRIKLTKDSDFSLETPRYYEKAGMIYYPHEPGYVIDIKDLETKQINVPENWVKTICYSENCDDGKSAISDGNKIYYVDSKGNTEEVIDCPGLTPAAIYFVEGKDELIVLYNDGNLYWYTKDGHFIRKAEISFTTNYNGGIKFDVDDTDNLLYIQIGAVTDVVDINSGVEITHLNNSFGYHMATDRFLTESYNDNSEMQIGYYKRYTVEELIEKANAILQDAELPDEIKSQYGIEDD